MDINKETLQEKKAHLEAQKRMIDEQLRAIVVVEKLFDEGAGRGEAAAEVKDAVVGTKYSNIPLGKVCLDILKSSDKSWTVGEIMEAAKRGGYDFGSDDKPKITVSCTLLNLVKKKNIEQIKENGENVFRKTG